MQTQTPSGRQLILPVAFTLTCVVLMILIWHAFGGSQPLAAKGYRVDVPLPQALNLNPNADVRIAGVTVGKVVDVRRDGPRGARATLDLKPKYAPLRAGARAVLRTKSLLGEAFVEVTPGAARAPFIRDGGSFPRSDVQTAQRLDDVLATFRPSTRRDFRRLFAGLATAFAGRGQALNDSLAHMEPFTGNLGEVLDTLDAQRSDIRSVVARSGDIFTALGSREGVLQAAVTAGNEVFDATARRNRELAATIHALPPFLRQVRRTSGTVSAASGDLAGAIGPLRSIARELPGALRETERSAPEFRGLFRELPRTLKAANTGLPAATRMFRASAPALRDIYPTSREFLPFLQLLGLSRRPLVGLFADVGAQSNGVSLGPGGQRIHTAGGAVTVWNESVGGWTRRLPTNRMNPYFKPGGTESVGGLLKAYDCRNTDNPEYLPPTGTGAPPCVLQGPWEFNGTRQYFPHLTLAPP